MSPIEYSDACLSHWRIVTDTLAQAVARWHHHWSVVVSENCEPVFYRQCRLAIVEQLLTTILVVILWRPQEWIRPGIMSQ